MGTRRKFLTAIFWRLPIWAAAQTPAIASPQGNVIAAFNSIIRSKNSGQNALFNLEMLDILRQTAFSTTTIWTEGKITFSGPSVIEVLDWLAPKPERTTVSAANDYLVSLVGGAVGRNVPILATHKNGLPFLIREAGPIWFVDPMIQRLTVSE